MTQEERSEKKGLYFPEQHHRIVPVDEPVVVEIEGAYRFILLDPVRVPEEHNGIVPVCETVGVQVFEETVTSFL
jgi:hypothetical protein